MSDYTSPIKIKWNPLRKCVACGKRIISTNLYEVHNNGLNSHIEYNVCKKCMRRGKENAKIE